MSKIQIGSKTIFAAIATTGLAGVLMVTGCNNSPKYPDSKDAVTTALKQNDLGSIDVSQDRDKGVMTLTGNVASQDLKSQAESVTKQAAPDYTVADEIGVRPPDASSQASAVASDQDSAIEDNYKAELKKHRNLDDQSISVKSKNGTVVLSGSVKTAAQKREAEKLAKAVPHVQQVVNEIEVKPKKDSTSN